MLCFVDTHVIQGNLSFPKQKQRTSGLGDGNRGMGWMNGLRVAEGGESVPGI